MSKKLIQFLVVDLSLDEKNKLLKRIISNNNVKFYKNISSYINIKPNYIHTSVIDEYLLLLNDKTRNNELIKLKWLQKYHTNWCEILLYRAIQNNNIKVIDTILNNADRKQGLLAISKINVNCCKHLDVNSLYDLVNTIKNHQKRLFDEL